MARITLTLDTADYQHPADAARLTEELRTAMREGEGITLRTGGGKFTVDVVAADPAAAEPAAAEAPQAESDHIECVPCAAYGTFACRESVGTCGLCGEFGDVFMEMTYTSEDDFEGTATETVCLTCLCKGKHLKCAHTPAAQEFIRGLGIAIPAASSELAEG